MIFWYGDEWGGGFGFFFTDAGMGYDTSLGTNFFCGFCLSSNSMEILASSSMAKRSNHCTIFYSLQA